MYANAPKNNIAIKNLSLLCDLELIMGLHAIVPLLDFVHVLIKLAQSCDVFICNFIDAMVCHFEFY
jgi:hypothetical protein